MSEGTFTEFEHTGDVGIEVCAPSRLEMFGCAMVAIARLMVAEGGIREIENRIVTASADNDIDLIHDLLSSALNLFLIDEFIWRGASIAENVRGEGDRELTATLAGEHFDPSRHEFRGEIKAVTYHQLTVDQAENGSWQARIIFDR